MSNEILAIDVGGSKIVAGLVDTEGNILCREKTALPDGYDAAGMVDAIVAAARDLEILAVFANSRSSDRAYRFRRCRVARLYRKRRQRLRARRARIRRLPRRGFVYVGDGQQRRRRRDLSERQAL